MACWSRRNAVEPGRVRRAGAAAASSRSTWSASGPRPVERLLRLGVAASPPTRRPCARCPASVSSSARPSAKTQRAMPPRGLADCFSSGLSRPPCMRWTTNVAAPKSSSRYLPRRPTKTSALADRGLGGGHEGLQRGEGDRPELGQRGAGEVGVEPLGVGLDLGQLGHQYSRARPRTAANTSSTPSKVRLVGHQQLDVAAHPQLADHERGLGRQLAPADGGGGLVALAEGHVGASGASPGRTLHRAVVDHHVPRGVAVGPVGDGLLDDERHAGGSPAGARRRRRPLGRARRSTRVTRSGPRPAEAMAAAAALRSRPMQEIGRGTKVFDAAAVAGHAADHGGPGRRPHPHGHRCGRGDRRWSATPARPSSRRSTTSSPGIVCTSGTPRSHIGIVSREFQVPCAMAVAFADGEPRRRLDHRARLLRRRGARPWLTTWSPRRTGSSSTTRRSRRRSPTSARRSSRGSSR